MADRFDELAAYNVRVEQGIVHTFEYRDRMARLQAEFDVAQEAVASPDLCGQPMFVGWYRENGEFDHMEHTICRRRPGHQRPDSHSPAPDG